MRLIDMLRHMDNSWIERNPTVIVADNVGRQFDELAKVKTPIAPADWYGCIAPPFPLFFIETCHYEAGEVMHIGILFEDMTAIDNPPENMPDELWSRKNQSRWVVGCNAWVMWNKKDVFSYPGTVRLHIDENGYLLDDTSMYYIHIDPRRNLNDPRYLNPDGLPDILPFALKTISLMHLRTEADHVTPPSAQNRKYRKKTGINLSSYHTIKIKPLDGKVYTYDDICHPITVPASKAKHSVRGHFRYYHPDRPLFGHTHGMIWINPHERGILEDGEVFKDYEIGEDHTI